MAQFGVVMNTQPQLVTKPVVVQEVDHVETGRAFREWRVSHKCSIRELARRSGFSAPYISDLERGKRRWTQRHMELLAYAIKS